MKIAKIIIKQLFGISEFEAGNKDIELLGANGTGKTSIIDAIRYALKNDSNRDYIIKSGEKEGEILIETDSGIRISRKCRQDKADYKSVKEEGKEISGPEAFLRGLFTELQLNPVEFLGMTKKEQNAIVLDLIDFEWDHNWIIKQFGELVPDINYEQNILCVLHDIQSEDSYYYVERQDLNREAREKTAIVTDIAATIPSDYSVKHWEEFDLGEVYRKVEKIQSENNHIEKAKASVENSENKMRSFEADLSIEVSSIEKATNVERSSINDRISDLNGELLMLTDSLENLDDKEISKVKIAKAEHEVKVSEFKAEIKCFEEMSNKTPSDYSTIQEEAENAEKMKKHINEYNRMLKYQKDIETLNERSEDFTSKIEKARSLPGEILSTAQIPIEGLTVKEGIPLINELPISNLSEGEKLRLCIDIATQNPNALNILLIDGLEKLSTHNRNGLYKQLKEKGVQFVATRTTDHAELVVCEL